MSELTTNKSNSYLEQAAILLLCLGEEAAATVMQKLSREEVVRLSENMARLSGVKTSMARKVINNFFDEFREQSGINGASRSMLQGILNKALGTEIASSVINGIYGDEIRSRMARLQWVDLRRASAIAGGIPRVSDAGNLGGGAIVSQRIGAKRNSLPGGETQRR